MIKRMSVYSLKEGTDKDAFWKYHTQVHAPHIVEAAGPGQTKYIVNRVIKTAYGEPPCFGIVEQVFESEEAMNKYVEAMKTVKLPSGKTVFDDFGQRPELASNATFLTEEFIVKDSGIKSYATKGSKTIKRVFTTSPKEGTDKDAFWKYWTGQHAPDIIKASGPGLLKYVLNRVAKVVYGEPKFFALMEMWYESEEAMNKDFETWKTLKLPSGESIFDDFENRVTGSWAATMEEFVAKDITS